MLTAVSVVLVGFAVNFLTSGGASWWWWLALGVGVVAGIVGGILGILGLKRERNDQDAGEPVQGGAAGQQTASDSGTNISINADRGSVAAYQMGEVQVGQTRRRGKRKGS